MQHNNVDHDQQAVKTSESSKLLKAFKVGKRVLNALYWIYRAINFFEGGE